MVSVIKRMVRMQHLGFGLLSILLAGGCSRAPEESGTNPQEADVSSLPAGEAIFHTRCFVCQEMTEPHHSLLARRYL
jgi:hypothetical protein